MNSYTLFLILIEFLWEIMGFFGKAQRIPMKPRRHIRGQVDPSPKCYSLGCTLDDLR